MILWNCTQQKKLLESFTRIFAKLLLNSSIFCNKIQKKDIFGKKLLFFNFIFCTKLYHNFTMINLNLFQK